MLQGCSPAATEIDCFLSHLFHNLFLYYLTICYVCRSTLKLRLSLFLTKLLHAISSLINLYFFYVCISWIKLAHVSLLVPLTNTGMEIQDGSLVLHIWCKPAATVALFYVVIPFSLASCYFVIPPVTQKKNTHLMQLYQLSLFINSHCSIFMKSDNWYYKNTFWVLSQMYAYACHTSDLNTSKDMDGQIQLCDFIVHTSQNVDYFVIEGSVTQLWPFMTL